jgi:hypothetical protein
LQDPPKFTQSWIFGLKNRPSGNPDRTFGAPQITGQLKETSKNTFQQAARPED